VLRGHTAAVRAACSLGLDVAASGSDDSSVRIWDCTSGECAGTLSGHTAAVWAVCHLDDGALVSGAWDATLRVWRLDGTGYARNPTNPIRVWRRRF